MSKVTPAIYALTEHVSRPVVATRWNEFVAIFNAEERLYERAIKVYHTCDPDSIGLDAATTIYLIILRNTPPPQVEQKDEILFGWILDEYWQLAITLGTAPIPFPRAITEWQDNNPMKVSKCEGRLRTWEIPL